MKCLELKIIQLSSLLLIFASMANSQVKKSTSSHPEQGEPLLNEAENGSKDTSRLQTVEGRVKAPSPKVI